MFKEYEAHDVAVYAGYLKDANKCRESSSGGIGTALAEAMLEQDGYVAGVAYSEDFYRAEYIMIHHKEEINRLKGSKYIECGKNNIYLEVKKLLDAGERVLFFGLPCVVGALYSFLGERPEGLLTCELVCHGPTSAKVHAQYIGFLEKTHGSKVVEFSVRHKKEGWTPACLYAKFQNGTVFEKPFYQTEYGYGFAVLGREACYHCAFKGNHRQGDLMIGDFWGATKSDVFWNPNGVSVIFAETQRGDRFLQCLSEVALFPTNFKTAVTHNYMVIASRDRKPNRDRFAELLHQKGLIYAARHCKTIEEKLARIVSKVLCERLKSHIKKIYGVRKKRNGH